MKYGLRKLNIMKFWVGPLPAFSGLATTMDEHKQDMMVSFSLTVLGGLSKPIVMLSLEFLLFGLYFC
jgi:hypothetical protein